MPFIFYLALVLMQLCLLHTIQLRLADVELNLCPAEHAYISHMYVYMSLFMCF